LAGFPAVYLDELFLSIQGEAGQVGKPHLFLRLAGCPLRCNYCDTPRSWRRTPTVDVHHADGVQQLANPWSVEQLEQQLHALAGAHGLNAEDLVLSVTGGEPLVQTEFLCSWLPQWGGPVLLETSGIFAGKLAKLLPELDYVSLDWKDEADLDTGANLLDPQASLTLLAGEAKQRQHSSLHSNTSFQFWLKFVVQAHTSSAWLQEQLQLIAELAPDSAVFLQPVTPGATDAKAPSASALLAELIQGHSLPLDLRVLPQIHPMLGVL
jgi:7-carboxy-7-deazaguanine synthase